MIVIDTSALIDSFLNLSCAEKLKQLIESEPLAAPDILYAESLQVLRKMERLGTITTIFAERCISVLGDLPIQRFSTIGMLGEAWNLRHNLSAYDAFYVALAGRLNAKLLTHDHRLAGVAADHVDTLNLFATAP